MTKIVYLAEDQKRISMPVIQKSLDRIETLRHFNDPDLKVVTEKAENISKYSREAYSIIRDRSVLIRVALENFENSDVAEVISELNLALTEVTSEEDKADLQEQINLLVEDSKDEIRGIVDLYEEGASSLKLKTTAIYKVAIRELCEDLIPKNQLRLKKREEELALLENEKKELEKDAEKIRDALDVINEKKLADSFKDLMPENLDKMLEGKATPSEAEIIKYGVNAGLKFIESTEEGLNAESLRETRDYLVGRIEEVEGYISSKKEEIRLVTTRLDTCKQGIELEDNKDCFVEQCDMIVAHWQMVAQTIRDNSLSSKKEQDQFNQLVGQEKEFLSKLV
ncbi:MAG: alpha-xenorhabdolysin family binary toxin subunit B [Marinifilaceae bacterium]